MDPQTAAVLIAAILGGGGVFSVIQFFITLVFSRKDKTKELEEKLDDLRERIDATLAAVATFLGAVLGISSINYAKKIIAEKGEK